MSDAPLKKDAFRTAIRSVDAHRKALSEAGAREDVVSALEAIVKFLHRMPDYQVSRIMGVNTSSPMALRREAAIKSAESMDLEEVEQKISDEDTSRGDLEAIAIGRFHVPRGSMRSLGNIDLLREKLLTFVQNEKTHATITELAQKSR